jgi:hypothetical protein
MFDDGPEAVNQHTKSHVIKQIPDYSSKIRFLTQAPKLGLLSSCNS